MPPAFLALAILEIVSTFVQDSLDYDPLISCLLMLLGWDLTSFLPGLAST
jgi:hypothetical protein